MSFAKAVAPLLLGGALACGGDDGEGNGETSRVDQILALTGDDAAGAVVYDQRCANELCHGSDGRSGPGADLPTVVPSTSDETIVTIVIEGTGSMPAQSVTNREAADVLAYLRSTFP